jgi:hypothetical protein
MTSVSAFALNPIGHAALVVGKEERDYSGLNNQLRDWGCECESVMSCKDALEALQKKWFKVILSSVRLRDGSAYKLIPFASEKSNWLFAWYPVNNGCWWIPLVERGNECTGASALWTTDFAKLLRQILLDLPYLSPNRIGGLTTFGSVVSPFKGG